MAMNSEGIGTRPIDSSWTADVVRINHDLEAELADPARMEVIAQALADIALKHRASIVTGASPIGNQLAGLIAARLGNRVSLWARNGARGTLLIIEGVLVSGAQVAATARRGRAAGAESVVAVAVVANAEGLAVCRSQIGGNVAALRELVLTP